MDRDEILSWVKAERLGLADLLDDLEDHEWEAASLCSGWTVRDVAAHLTLSTGSPLLGTIRDVIRARGDFNRMEADKARERAARFEPAELVAHIRATAGSARRSLGSRPLDPLVDMLVHGQDIVRPLGRVREMPVERAIAALDHVRVDISPAYGARKRLRGTRLVATDVEWSAGKGPDEVRGPVGDLLLVATGRAAGLAGLSGPGAERIAATL
ncbi:maleylpyruvate isomerase family mycothiol-dependent enzyme [Actinomadura alba]|uniref:Maleylpyruvate isomerase family mycothiol-dependent enzyme n=1 Tax=Actinomadura alba TaxID=406431 RepID=A0ABR7LZX6_9ACTN|nr:maleylpyruvate isomerase family mycothiol-dependent enzyme [Actinomadura alba]MBC6470408.1 maleylpyruvate isomerase family mycothiol-dependent enzyme [Actinomadura alba]